MATTKIWAVRDNLKRSVGYVSNPKKTEYDDIKKALHYVGSKKKTSVGDESFCFVTGVGCNTNNAYDEMMAVKKRFGKTDGNLAYHAYQSFKPGEVTPELCHEIGVKLARNLWGDRYQVVVATHLDRGHLHNHFLINSVSYVNGKMFNDNKRTYYKMRSASDMICKSYELSVIKNPKGKTPRNIYFAEKNGEPTKFNLMREAIDTALKITSCREDFKEVLRDMGYLLNDNPNHKYATLKRIGSDKAVRLFRLGDEYDLPEIDRQLQRNYYQYGRNLYGRYRKYEMKSFHPPRKYRVQGSLATAKRMNGLRGFYLVYLFRLGAYPKQNYRRPLSPEMREECRRLDEISRQVRLICKENFKTTDDVKAFIEKKNDVLTTLNAEQNNCYNKLRRCDDPALISEIKKHRDDITAAMNEVRREKKTAEKILTRSETMHQNLQAEQQMQSEKQQRDMAAYHYYRRKERNYER